MGEILLIRHAIARAGPVDPPLAYVGPEQADQLGMELLARQIEFQDIYSSPKLRAIETAQISTRHIGICSKDILQRDDLVEGGELESDENEYPNQRVKRFLETLMTNEQESNYAVYTHGYMIYTTINQMLDANLRRMPHHASISVLRYGPQGIQLVKYDDHNHIETKTE